MTSKSWLLCCSLLLLVQLIGPVQATQVTSSIQNDVLRWTSAHSASGGLAPAIWETPGKLTPADTFIPGGPIINSLPLNFVGPKGGTVSLTLQLLGMEYNSPESIDTTQPDTAGGSAAVSVSGGVINVDGIGIGNSKVSLSRSVSPFTHARPIFSLGDSADIVKAFADANLTKGDYTVQVLLPMAYEYYRADVRARHNWSLPLTFVINYDPVVLSDVTLVSPTAGVMAPQYAQRPGMRLVSGQATFNGTATGRFPNGLRVRLKTGDQYQMDGPDSTFIPFSVTCHGCVDSQLVENGLVLNNALTTTGTRIEGINATQLTFSVMVNFDDIDVSTLRTGAYQGVFSMLFEPDV